MLRLLERQPTPAEEKMKILTALIQNFELDINTVWALIDAYNYGVITGKRLEREKTS